MKTSPLAIFAMIVATAANGQGLTAAGAFCKPPTTYPVSGLYYFASIGGGNTNGLGNADTGGLAGDPLAGPSLDLPFVKGAFLRCQWNEISHSLVAINAGGAYDFSCIDNNYNFLKAHNKLHIDLAFFENSLNPATPGVNAGNAALPSDYVAAGGEYVNLINSQVACGIPVTYPLPWGTNFQNMWFRDIDAVAAHLTATGEMSAIDKVDLSGLNADTAEFIMQLVNSGSNGGTGTCVCNDNTNTACTNGSNVNVPDQHIQWKNAGYTKVKMNSFMHALIARVKIDFPGKVVSYMSGYNNSQTSPPYNGSTPDIDDNGNIDYTNPCLAALGSCDFFTDAQNDLGNLFMAQSNDYHAAILGSHGRVLVKVSSNLSSGGGAAMQWGQRIWTASGVINSTCIMNGDDLTNGCTGRGEQIRGQNGLLDFGIQMSIPHGEDLLYGDQQLWSDFVRGCHR